MQGFKVEGASEYIKFTLDIDRTSDVASKWEHDRNPKFSTETHLLKLLSSGDVDLYEYREDFLTRYIIQVGTSDPEQLIYKKYLVDVDGVANVTENSTFRNQLYTALQCGETNSDDFKHLDYRRRDIEKMINDYNVCTNSTVEVAKAKKVDNPINMSLRLGLRMFSLGFSSAANNVDPVEFANKPGYSIGALLEYKLPFNKNKWSLTAEPTFNSSNLENKFDYPTWRDKDYQMPISVNYQSLELILGTRYYFYFGQNLKMFGAASLTFDKPLGATIVAKDENTNLMDLELSSTPSSNLSVGLQLWEKVGVEVRYGFRRRLLQQYDNWKGEYKSVNFLIGYTF